MKVNFDTQLTDMHGEVIRRGLGTDDAATLGFVCEMALIGDTEGDLAAKLKTFKILKLIAEAKGEVDIEPETAAFLQSKIGRPGFQNTLIVGRCHELLNG